MKIFNSKLEISLRILILLKNVNAPVSTDFITTIDLFTTYGKNYRLALYNLHGDSSFKFSEIASRRILVNAAIQDLVIKNLVIASKTKDGFSYKISEKGEQIILQMESDYYKKYNSLSKNIIEKTSNMNEVQLINYATKQTVGGDV